MNKYLKRILPIFCILTLCACDRVTVPPAGQIEGNHYENQYLGIACDLPEQFSVQSAERLEEINKLSNTASDTASSDATRKSAEALYDFYAVNQSTGSSLTVVYTNLTIRFGDLENDDAYLAAVKEYVASNFDAMDDMTAEISQSVAPFLGEAYPEIYITGVIDETVAYFERMVCIRKGDYMAILTATTIGTDDTEALLKSFTKLN